MCFPSNGERGKDPQRQKGIKTTTRRKKPSTRWGGGEIYIKGGEMRSEIKGTGDNQLDSQQVEKNIGAKKKNRGLGRKRSFSFLSEIKSMLGKKGHKKGTGKEGGKNG